MLRATRNVFIVIEQPPLFWEIRFSTKMYWEYIVEVLFIPTYAYCSDSELGHAFFSPRKSINYELQS